jgi:hypothetical protein
VFNRLLGIKEEVSSCHEYVVFCLYLVRRVWRQKPESGGSA